VTSELTYSVPDISCEHCRTAVTSALQPLAGVSSVDVDLDAKRVVVHGDPLDDAAIRAALAEAGYDAA
jgi:copper chaperone